MDSLPTPHFPVPLQDSFTGNEARIHESRERSDDDREWLAGHLDQLRTQFAQHAPFRWTRLIHE